MLILHNSKEFWNRVLREVDLYLVTFMLPLGVQKWLSFIFHYSLNFTCGLNVVSQPFIFHNFDVLLCLTVFGESVFWQILVNAFAS